ncbi:MAG: hypothetical protein HQL39_01575 [Alphaproteobacteria bacterium]|nr:hypothetical protein [Alphaproteobacteria bacterium]
MTDSQYPEITADHSPEGGRGRFSTPVKIETDLDKSVQARLLKQWGGSPVPDVVPWEKCPDADADGNAARLWSLRHRLFRLNVNISAMTNEDRSLAVTICQTREQRQIARKADLVDQLEKAGIDVARLLAVAKGGDLTAELDWIRDRK